MKLFYTEPTVEILILSEEIVRTSGEQYEKSYFTDGFNDDWRGNA